MSYEYFYPGTPSSLEPTYGDIFTGYRIPVAGFGLASDPRTALQLQEVSNKLSVGTKTMEVSMTDSNVMESIPKQHWQEMNRLSKVTGISPTLHAPMIEASGYTREGWSEIDRKAAETQMKNAVEKAHELNPDGNIPVTFHTTTMLPLGEETTKEEVEGKMVEVSKSAYVVDPETGRIGQLRETKRYFPGEPTKFDVKKELEKQNEEQWRNMLTHLAFNTSRGVDSLESSENIMSKDTYLKLKSGEIKFDDLPPPEQDDFKRAFRNRNTGEIFLKDGYRELREIFNKAYRAAEETNLKNDKEILDNYKKEVESQIKAIDDPDVLSKVVERGLEVLNKLENVPQLVKPLNEFLLEKSSKTFGDVAFHSYQEYGEKAPIISIENPPYGAFGLSRAEDVKKVIEKTREEFVKKAKENGVSESKAEEMAEKLVGATWDVGHINMLRKYGYDKVDVIKEAEKIAPFVKHVHLSDNFGLEHTELPMGMGNVPIKEIMEKLGKKGEDAKKIIEAGNWWQHMKTPPFGITLESFGSPVYGTGAPYWNQAIATYGNYFAFPSAYLPEQHFTTIIGGGFSGLPPELGGQLPGKQSRATGAPVD